MLSSDMCVCAGTECSHLRGACHCWQSGRPTRTAAESWGSKLSAAVSPLAMRRSVQDCRGRQGCSEWPASSGQGAGHESRP